MKKSLTVLIIIALCGILTACGAEKITPVTQEIELGSDVNATDLIKYNNKKITRVLPADFTSIDTKTLGTVDVTYTIFAKNGKQSTQTLSFSVVDTTAPDFTKCDDRIYLNKGEKFLPAEHIIASDTSGEVTLSYSGELDTAAAGEYPITICATDSSGNMSESETVIIIEDRTPDVRNVMFGDSKDTVMRYESAQFEGDLDKDTGTSLHYSTSVNDIDMALVYYINNNDELYEVVYLCQENSKKYATMKSEYDDLKTMLDNKYGKGTERVIKRDLYNYCSSDSQAFQLGYLGFTSTWSAARMDIQLAIYDEALMIKYTSTEYAETPNASGL